ncbi:hypothetical protein [Acidipropionibacterium virtanenii]|uniref:hypothetical protein n=1 Tax=Acidipropionibacterium virtanenii TaxID=2057246 RepID=UPI0011BEA1EC|nr:hypothetical protein [Acidipropionibacterium virtanenii]
MNSGSSDGVGLGVPGEPLGVTVDAPEPDPDAPAPASPPPHPAAPDAITTASPTATHRRAPTTRTRPIDRALPAHPSARTMAEQWQIAATNARP